MRVRVSVELKAEPLTQTLVDGALYTRGKIKNLRRTLETMFTPTS